jgi:hypothetical protein
MTLPERSQQNIYEIVQQNTYEIAGFFTSAIAAPFAFADFLEKAAEVTIFAFISGMIGAFGAHLYKLIVSKINHQKKHETKTKEGL